MKYCLHCDGPLVMEGNSDLLCRHCARDLEEAFEADEEGAGDGRRTAAGGDEGGRSHRQLLEKDEAYREADNFKDTGDPVEILKRFAWGLGKPLIPGYPKRKNLWRIDLVAFLGFYGVERVLGNSLALFLPKLLCFRHDKIYVSRSKLAAYRGLTRDWGAKVIKRLVRPWCLNCCKAPTAKDQCAHDKHDWQPPLFFKERIRNRRRGYYLTYLRPNMPAFESLINITFTWWRADTEDSNQSDTSLTAEERRGKYDFRRQQAAHARRAKAEKAKAAGKRRG